MGLLDRLKALGTGFGKGKAKDSEPSETYPAMDAPFERPAPEVPTMLDADAASAGFPSELR